MSDIEFSREQSQQLAKLVKDYLSEQFDLEIGSFEAEFMADFIGREFGGHFYNKGLEDARLVLEKKLEDIGDTLYELERPVGR